MRKEQLATISDHYLPKLEKGKVHNLAPIQAFLDGVIDIGMIHKKEASAILKEVRMSDMHGLLERGPLKKRNLTQLFLFTAEQIHQRTGLRPQIEHHDRAALQGVDMRVRQVLEEGEGKKNRVIIMDEENAYLVVGTRLTDQYKVRPRLKDPHHTQIREDMRNRDFMQLLQRGFWIVSSSDTIEGIEDTSSEQLVFP